jgi:hypothetical protein
MKRRICDRGKLLALAIAAAIVLTYASTAYTENRTVSVSIAFGTNSASAQIIETNNNANAQITTNLSIMGDSHHLDLYADCAASNTWSDIYLNSTWHRHTSTSHYIRLQCRSTVTNVWVIRGATGNGYIDRTVTTTLTQNPDIAPSYNHSLTINGYNALTQQCPITFCKPITVVHTATLTIESTGTVVNGGGWIYLCASFHIDEVYDQNSNVLNDVEITSIDSGLYPAAPDIRVNPANNELNFSWYSLTNETYDLLTCSNLAQESWTTHTTNIPPSPPLNTITLPPDDGSQFYMLRTAQP